LCVNSGPEAHYIYPNGDEISVLKSSIFAENGTVNRNLKMAKWKNYVFYQPMK